jgi:short-subunit dehydrogenase
MKRFEGEVVWLTGASSGIGEAMVRELVRRDAKVVASARREDRLDALNADLGASVAPMVLDVADADPVVAARQAAERFGPIDVLVHAAGIGQRARAVEASVESVRRIMEVNFFGAVALTQAVLPTMLERGSGQIAVISSLAGHVGTPRRSAYSASKHALQGYFDSLRAEVHAQGVAVTMVCPGYVASGFTQHALTADGTAYASSDAHKKNALSPERCASLAVDAIAARERERFMGGKELAARWVKRVSPALLARVVRGLDER